MTADYKTLLQQKAELEAKIAATLKAVSYTHLTLPTILLV